MIEDIFIFKKNNSFIMYYNFIHIQYEGELTFAKG